jgi:hypothetical protein
MSAARVGPPDEGFARRRQVYVLLITVAAAGVGGRILTLRPTPTPTFGSNDRSRWATVRALVDEGTYAIGRRDPALATPKNPYGDTGIAEEDGWQTIDKVLRPDTQTFFSSKPPLLPTLLAGEYWLQKQVFGVSITDPGGVVIRTILFTVNWLPLVFYWLVLGRMVEQLGATDWGRWYVMAAGCFATFLTPFAVSLNNHVVAAWSTLFALYFALRVPGSVGNRRWAGDAESGRATADGLRTSVLSGLFAGFATTNELPSATLAAVLFLWLLVRRPWPALAGFLPAAALPVAALLFTNYGALGQWTLAYGEFGGPWYEYPGSHWRLEPGVPKAGIDWAWQTESRGQYVFHFLLGHHGLFSLSPIFLLSAASVGVRAAAGRRPTSTDETKAARRGTAGLLTIGALGLTAVVAGFYLFVTPLRTHNYGGWTSGPRHLMWLTPLLLLAMVPCADRLAGSRGGRVLGYALLAVSVLSVSYSAANPWRHPWIYDFMEWQGWLAY